MAAVAFVAGAVVAGFAIKVPGGSVRGVQATTAPPAAADKREAATKPCEQQVWPYIDNACRKAKANTEVAAKPEPTVKPPPVEPARVVTLQKEAAPTAAAAEMPSPPQMPSPSQTSPPQTGRPSGADANTGAAPRELAQAEQVPTPKKPRPERISPARATQQALDNERAAKTVADRENALAAKENSVRQPPAPPASKVKEAASNKVKEAVNKENKQEAANQEAANKENKQIEPNESARKAAVAEVNPATRSRADARRTHRAERSVAARQPTGEARNDQGSSQRSASMSRSQSVQARNEEEGFSLVRGYRLPDGRRVTVYRRVEESAPAMAYDDDRPRRGFLPPAFSGFASSRW